MTAPAIGALYRLPGSPLVWRVIEVVEDAWGVAVRLQPPAGQQGQARALVPLGELGEWEEVGE
jgi:hypothetical protein